MPNLTETSSCTNLEPHDYKIVKQTWQTVDYVRYQILNHSRESVVCSKCGDVVDPFVQVSYSLSGAEA